MIQPGNVKGRKQLVDWQGRKGEVEPRVDHDHVGRPLDMEPKMLNHHRDGRPTESGQKPRISVKLSMPAT